MANFRSSRVICGDKLSMKTVSPNLLEELAILISLLSLSREIMIVKMIIYQDQSICWQIILKKIEDTRTLVSIK